MKIIYAAWEDELKGKANKEQPSRGRSRNQNQLLSSLPGSPCSFYIVVENHDNDCDVVVSFPTARVRN